MSTSAYYPYKSEALRDSCFAYFDSLAARDWPMASEERTVTTQYGTTFVRISGPADGPPLVLLPGAATSSLMWAPNIQAFSAGYRTFAVDQMADFGRSICTKRFKTYSDIVDWLDGLLDALGLDRGVNLAGISFGGALVAEYALRFPARVGKAVIIAPGATVLHLRAEFVVRLIVAALAYKKGLPSLMRWIFADAARQDPKWLNETLEALFVNMRSLERRQIPNPRVWSDAEWASLKVPALFLVGEHEVIYSAEKAVQRLNRVAPQIRTELVHAAGHDLTFVQAKLVNQLILDFLNQTPAAS